MIFFFGIYKLFSYDVKNKIGGCYIEIEDFIIYCFDYVVCVVFVNLFDEFYFD